MIFDDMQIWFKPKIRLCRLSDSNFERCAQLVISSPIIMSRDELLNYKHSLDGDFFYKHALIALIKDEPVGIALLTDCEDTILLNHLYVVASHRFKGIGSILNNKFN